MERLKPRDPQSIGPYTLIGRLGAGGMGIVYLASDATRSVALKVMRESLVGDGADATRFTREIQALQAIDSKYVAKIYDSGMDDDRAWFATEFVNGPNLKTLVTENGPLSEEQWFGLADGLREGLRAIHAAGVIHRDVKPANIIMSEVGPKLIDFGIAQLTDVTSVTSSGVVAGSPIWFSPEQIDGLSLTPATDVFSAGSTLVYAASGSSPWGDETTTNTSAAFNRILNKPPDVSALSARQQAVVAPMLNKDPQRRGSTPAVVVGGGTGKKTTTKKVTRTRTSASWWKKPAILIPAVAAVGAIVLAGVHLQPASGSVWVYQNSSYTSNNPVLGELSMTISRGDRIPIDIALDNDARTSSKPDLTTFAEVVNWDDDDWFEVELVSSFSDDEPMIHRFDLSEHTVSGLIRDPKIGVTVGASDTSFTVHVMAPRLSGGSVVYETISSVEFPRGNERVAIAQCESSEGDSLERKYSEALGLNRDWNVAYQDSGMDTSDSLFFDTWAYRAGQLKRAGQGLLDAVEQNSERGIHPALDAELDATLARGEAKLVDLQEFIDYNYRYLYGGHDEDTWQDLVFDASDLPRGFNRAVIGEVAGETCDARID